MKQKTNVEIQKAKKLGFCFGVRRAIKLIKNASGKHRGIATLGPIVHNRLVVDTLAELGVNSVRSLSDVRDKCIGISSHGVPPHLLSDIEKRHLEIIDTTCPTVRKAQKAAKKLADAGFGVIIFGEAEHPEVKGLLGWAGDKAIATMDGEELAGIKLPKRLGILSQTTQNKVQFAKFVKKVMDASFPEVQELRVVNTVCDETQKRQEAAVELARRSDLVIVIGGHNSANTKHLAELCSPIAATHLIESAAEIKKGWIKGKKHIGITAGTSTPDEAIDEVAERLNRLLSH
jgi:4-hydroxy-3-methylbut-2-en-1-yl diphosphate reductase